MPEFKVVKHQDIIDAAAKFVVKHTESLPMNVIQSMHERKPTNAYIDKVLHLRDYARNLILAPYTDEDKLCEDFDRATTDASIKFYNYLKETALLTADRIYNDAHLPESSRVDFRHPLDCSPEDYCYEIGRLLKFMHSRNKSRETYYLGNIRLARILAALNDAAINMGGAPMTRGFTPEEEIEKYFESADYEHDTDPNIERYW